MEDITLIKGFIKDTKDYYKLIDEKADWHTELKISVTGVMKKINRAMCYVSDYSTTYRYAGFEFPGTVWGTFYNDFFPLNSIIVNPLYEINQELKSIGLNFNSVLLNKYKDGRDEIRWHADKEDTLGDNPIIGCVNLGATRKFWFMNLETKEKFYHEVADGDLLIMGDMCQKKFLHAILKEKEVTEPRISLTFRFNYAEAEYSDFKTKRIIEG